MNHVARILGFKRRRRGTSMVEVLIAMAILAFVLITFLSVMNSASTTSSLSKENAIAVAILQSTMEDMYSTTYSACWDTYFNNNTATVVNTSNGPVTISNVFTGVIGDATIQSSLATITSLLPRVQGTGAPLTTAEKTTWNTIINQFKTHPFPLAPTNRLKEETINLYLLPTSDLYLGSAFNSSVDWKVHNYVEYMVEIIWTDATGKRRYENMTTRRSQ